MNILISRVQLGRKIFTNDERTFCDKCLPSKLEPNQKVEKVITFVACERCGSREMPTEDQRDLERQKALTFLKRSRSTS